MLQLNTLDVQYDTAIKYYYYIAQHKTPVNDLYKSMLAMTVVFLAAKVHMRVLILLKSLNNSLHKDNSHHNQRSNYSLSNTH
jgi:hypothetical protein